MFKEFKTYLTTSNALALAVGVIIGAAAAKLVSAIVADVLMPIISLITPTGDWREAQFVLRTTTDATGKAVVTAIKYGDLLGTVLDFLIIAYVAFLLVKALVPKKPEAPKVDTKNCPECLETVPMLAHRCKFCTAAIA